MVDQPFDSKTIREVDKGGESGVNDEGRYHRHVHEDVDHPPV